MTKKKQGSVIAGRPRRGAAGAAGAGGGAGGAALIQNVLQFPVLNVLPDPEFVSAQKRDPSSSQERDASVVEGRKVLCSAQVNVPPPARFNAPEYSTKPNVKASAEDHSKKQIVQQVCDAIDAEVKSRSATIRALAAAQYASLKAQLDLQISKFSTEELNMPLEEYLKTCPGITAVKSANGVIQLQKRSSPYPKLEESKRNLQDLLTKAKDGASKGTNSSLFTPCAEPKLPATESVTGQHVTQELNEKLVGEDLSWPDYCMRLQSLGFNTGLTPGLASHNKFNTPMIFKGGLSHVTPKTLRLPKPGETMLSVHGSPLGQFGTTPATAGGTTRITRTKSRLASSKRSLRDL